MDYSDVSRVAKRFIYLFIFIISNPSLISAASKNVLMFSSTSDNCSWCIQNRLNTSEEIRGIWHLVMSDFFSNSMKYTLLQQNCCVWQRNSTLQQCVKNNRRVIGSLYRWGLTASCFYFFAIYSIALKLHTIAFQFDWCFLLIFRITKQEKKKQTKKKQKLMYTLYPR